MSKTQNTKHDFDSLESATKPRDLAWTNWAKFEKVGDEVHGVIRDVFYRPSEGQFKEQRGITLEQEGGELINVGIKRLPFILNKTDDLHIGDLLKVELSELKKSSTKGFSSTKIFSFFKKEMPENTSKKTLAQLENEDMAKGGTKAPEAAIEEDVEGGDAFADLPAAK